MSRRFGQLASVVSRAARSTGTGYSSASRGAAPVAAVVLLGLSGGAVWAKEKGTIKTWGLNTSGQLGVGDRKSRPLPEELETLAGETIIDVSCGPTHALAVTADGTVYAWGSGKDSRLGSTGAGGSAQVLPIVVPMPGPVVSVAAGGSHSAAVAKDGSVYAWGKNNLMQCGRGNKVLTSKERKALHDQGVEPAVVEGLPRIRQVALGNNHTVCLSEEGELFVFGAARDGQLGIPAPGNSVASPQKLEGLPKISEVSCGRSFTVAVSEGGEVFSWGDDAYGQLGLGRSQLVSETPKQVQSIRNVATLCAGFEHVVAVTKDGEVYTWGYGRDGQLGHNNLSDIQKPKHVEALKGKKSVACAAGGGHSAVVTDKGAVFVFGKGRDGQLGRADQLESIAAHRPEPIEVEALRGQKVKKVALGGDYTIAITS